MDDNRLASELLLLLGGGEPARSSQAASNFPAILPAAEAGSIPSLRQGTSHLDEAGSECQDPLGSALGTTHGGYSQRDAGGLSHYGGLDLFATDFLRTPEQDDGGDGEADSTGPPVTGAAGRLEDSAQSPAAAPAGAANDVAGLRGQDQRQPAGQDEKPPSQQLQQQQHLSQDETKSGRSARQHVKQEQEQEQRQASSQAKQESDSGQQQQRDLTPHSDQRQHHHHHHHHHHAVAAAAAPAVDAVGSGGSVTLGAREREWLLAITTTMGFFKPCGRQHPGGLQGTDGIATFFDIDDPASGPMCAVCAADPARARHRVVQVRRSTYHEVLKMSDVTSLMDITGIQPYVINAAKVLFLRPRPQPRSAKGGAVMPAVCVVDGRQLMDTGSRYCSIRCKLEYEDAPFAAALAAVKPHEPYVPRPTSRAATGGHHKPHHKPPKDGTSRPAVAGAPSRTPPGTTGPSTTSTSDSQQRRAAGSPTLSAGAGYDGSRPGWRAASPAAASSGGGTAGAAASGGAGRKRGRQEGRVRGMARRSPGVSFGDVRMAPVPEEGEGLHEVVLPHWGTQVRRGRGAQLNMSQAELLRRGTSGDEGAPQQPLLHEADLSDSCSQKRRRGERSDRGEADSAAMLARAERRIRARRAAAARHNMVSDEVDGGQNPAGEQNPNAPGLGSPGKGNGSIMTSSRTTGADSGLDSVGSHRRKALTPQRSPLQ